MVLDPREIFEKYFHVFKTNTSTDKSAFKILQLFGVTFDMRCLRRAIHVV